MKSTTGHSLFCEDSGYKAWINKKLGCNFIGFKPTKAAIVQSDQVLSAPLLGKPSKEKLLVLQGETGFSNQPNVKTFVIPIDYLLEKVRNKKAIYWMLTGGGIRTGETPPYNDMNLDQVFAPKTASRANDSSSALNDDPRMAEGTALKTGVHSEREVAAPHDAVVQSKSAVAI